MKKLLFPPDEDWFSALPKDELNSLQKAHAEQAKSLLDEQYTAMNIQTKYTKSFRDVATYGTVFVKTLWEHRVRKSFTRDKNNERVEKFEAEFDNLTV